MQAARGRQQILRASAGNGSGSLCKTSRREGASLGQSQDRLLGLPAAALLERDKTSSEVRSCSLGMSQRQLVRIPIQIPLCLWQSVAPNAEVELRNLLSLFKFVARSLLLLLRARSHPVLAQHLQQRPGSPSQCSGGLSSMLLPAVSSWLAFPRGAGDRRGQAG